MTRNAEFSIPPPPINLPNMSVPPPMAVNLSTPPIQLPMIKTNYQPRFPNYKDPKKGFFKPFKQYNVPKLSISGTQDPVQEEFDGKRLRKSVMRKTVDYNSAIIKSLENRIWQRDYRDRRALQPCAIYYPDLLPPLSYIENPINAVTTRFVKSATNKVRCPVFCMAWTPEGRRLVTGASSGEFTLWNGLTFNFETILQAHDTPVRAMVWSHNESWMVTGDHGGYVKYWQSNMNNVKMFQAHKEAIRGVTLSPTDEKLATCSDDSTVRIWDFFRCYEERILRGHGADVKCVQWHPQKSLIISGSRDNQQPMKLWDPKMGQSLATIHAHKMTVMDVKWNDNGNWLVTASRDHLVKLFDLRNLSQEVQTFRGHKKEAASLAWHPIHEGLFCSGGSDGGILFWHVGSGKEVGVIEQAHESIVWTLAWHPLGHTLCSGGNDHTSKFWTRNRPGDLMRDKYNLNILSVEAPGNDEHEEAESGTVIPGMGPEDQISTIPDREDQYSEIPGMGTDHMVEESNKAASKKLPYNKPIPHNFQSRWNRGDEDNFDEEAEKDEALNTIVNKIMETTPGAVPLNDVTPSAIILQGKIIPVEPGSKLAEAIRKGTNAINKLVESGEIAELQDVIQVKQEQEDVEDYLHDDGDIDYNKVSHVNLPPPLPSSKFAQDPKVGLHAIQNNDYRQVENSYSTWDNFDNNDKKSWDEGNDKDIKPDIKFAQNNFDKHEERFSNSYSTGNTFNHHNVQNINVNMPPPNMQYQIDSPQHYPNMGPRQRMARPLPHIMPPMNVPPPSFRQNRPNLPNMQGFSPNNFRPPQNSNFRPPQNSNFRPPQNSNFSPNAHFRPRMDGSIRGSFNNFSKSSRHFRPHNPNFKRGFEEPKFRGQSSNEHWR